MHMCNSILIVCHKTKAVFLLANGWKLWVSIRYLEHETLDYDSGTRLLKLGFYPHFALYASLMCPVNNLVPISDINLFPNTSSLTWV